MLGPDPAECGQRQCPDVEEVSQSMGRTPGRTKQHVREMTGLSRGKRGINRRRRSYKQTAIADPVDVPLSGT